MKMKKENNRKADISASFLITVILGVLAFGIILIVYSQFSWTSQANQETCHQSVIFRATLPSLAGAKEFVPLKCQTEKICFTSGLVAGKCSEFENTKGVVKTKVSKKEQIEKEIAQKIIECWEMMGQGKLSLFSNDWFAQTYGFRDITSSCVICSRVAFDKESLAKSGINVQEIDVLDYMVKHYIPGKNITYYEYLGGNKGKISVKDENVEALINAFTNQIPSNVSSSSSSSSNTYVNSDELSIMFMQVYAPSYGDVFMNTLQSAGGLAVGSFISAPTLTGKVATTLGKAVVGHPYIAAAIAIIGGGYQAYSVFNNNAIASGYCGDIAVGDKAYKGCSVVRTVNYGAEDLSRYCSTIESMS